MLSHGVTLRTCHTRLLGVRFAESIIPIPGCPHLKPEEPEIGGGSNTPSCVQVTAKRPLLCCNRGRSEAGGGTVNALPPLKVVQLLGNAYLSPITLVPKGPFRPRGPKWILLFSLDSVEPHRVISNDLAGALGAGPRPERVGRPAAWFAPSHDVTTRLMFSSRADSFSPANRLHPHYQRASPSVSRASSLSRIVYNNHHSFTYAASAA